MISSVSRSARLVAAPVQEELAPQVELCLPKSFVSRATRVDVGWASAGVLAHRASEAILLLLTRLELAGMDRLHSRSVESDDSSGVEGKKGVDGSSPSEGFRFFPAQAVFPLSRPAMIDSCGVRPTSRAWTSAVLTSA